CPTCGLAFDSHEEVREHWLREHAPNLSPKAAAAAGDKAQEAEAAPAQSASPVSEKEASSPERDPDTMRAKIVEVDDQGSPVIVREEEPSARTIVTNEDGSHRAFGEAIVKSLMSKEMDKVVAWVTSMTDRTLRGLVNELSERFFALQRQLLQRREQLKEQQRTKGLAMFDLREDCTTKDLETAYRRLARSMHPDKNGGTEEAKERFQTMRARYEELKEQFEQGDLRPANQASRGEAGEPERPEPERSPAADDTEQEKDKEEAEEQAIQGSQDKGSQKADTGLLGAITAYLSLPEGKRGESDLDSSPQKRHRGTGTGVKIPHAPPVEGSVTLEAIQALLAQQSATIMEAQRSTLAQLEARQNARIENMEAKMLEQQDKSEAITDKLQALGERIARLEKGEGGNMLPDTKKMTNEAPSDTRGRMLEVITAINGAKASLAGSEKHLWASFSRTVEERGKAALPGFVKKVVMTQAPSLKSELDIEYSTGTSWIEDLQLSGMGKPLQPDHAMEISTKAGPGWIDVKGLASKARVPEDNTLIRMLNWNIGGVAIGDLTKALEEAGMQKLHRDDIVVLQEIPRGEQGWQSHRYEGLLLLSHRSENQWRGNAIGFSEKSWTVMRKIHSEWGIWLRLRHVTRCQEMWVGSLYVKPDCNQHEHHRRTSAHLEALPATQLPVILGADLNTPYHWVNTENKGLQAASRSGKGNQFLNQLASRGLEVLPPGEDHVMQVTSRPRQVGRQGRTIDFLAGARVTTREVTIHADSFEVLGTDHELLTVELLFTGLRNRRRPNTRPRVLTKPIPEVLELDQREAKRLAAEHTGVPKKKGYQDPASVRTLFQMARHGRSGQDWKKAFAERKKAKQAFREEQIRSATSGGWCDYKSLKKRPGTEWECHFAESQQGDPHKAIHDHLQGIYGNEPPDLTDFLPDTPFEPITPEELREATAAGKKGKSTGEDGTSQELLEGILQAPGGESAILNWFNEMLETGELPEDWFSSLMIVLPKTARPNHPKQVRPICLSSSMSKSFCRILLGRTKRGIMSIGSAQCAGEGKQAIDYIHTIAKLMGVEREWKLGISFVKIDLEKAFDCVSKVSLMAYIKSKIGRSHEARCWQRLLNRSEAHLHTAWGDSTIQLNNGIRQGSVESPHLFSCLAEMTLETTASRYAWPREDPELKGLKLTEIMFVDDATLWQSSLPRLTQRLEQWMVVLRESGLKVNLSKCQLYCSPYCSQSHRMKVHGTVLESDNHLNIMGMHFTVQGTACELLSSLLARARDKFWSCYHLLGSSATLASRLKLLEKVCAGAGLWCVAAFFPDRNSQQFLNSFQLQLVVYMMKLKRKPDEGWLEHRVRVFRAARLSLWRGGHKRWSTLWLERFWLYQGHVARGSDRSPPLAPSLVSNFRNREWWVKEKANPDGYKHPGRFYARSSLEEAEMDVVAGQEWRAKARNREDWRGLVGEWVNRMDVPWTSGRQISVKDL
ncbi:unnamed protein product, partial [Symbiodinium sp. CCMP2456]